VLNVTVRDKKCLILFRYEYLNEMYLNVHLKNKFIFENDQMRLFTVSFFFLNFSLGRFKTGRIIKTTRKKWSQVLCNVNLGHDTQCSPLHTEAVTNAKTEHPDEKHHLHPRERTCQGS